MIDLSPADGFRRTEKKNDAPEVSAQLANYAFSLYVNSLTR